MKIEATGNDDSSPFNRLPDEIVFLILNKLIDLKALCFCYVVCKRFCSIVVQIDTISITTPPPIVPDNRKRLPCINLIDACMKSNSFLYAVKSMKKFTGLKSLSINLPFPAQQQQHDNRYSFKWKYNVDSFLFLSPTSICNSDSVANNTSSNENGQEEIVEELKYKLLDIANNCLTDAIGRFSVLFPLFGRFPLLEKISITDSTKIGFISLRGGDKISNMRNRLLLRSKTSEYKGPPRRVSWCYIPLLKLPVSKYVIKGLALILVKNDALSDGYDSFLNPVEEDVFEDKEAVAYNEAVTEILKKHKGRIERLSSLDW